MTTMDKIVLDLDKFSTCYKEPIFVSLFEITHNEVKYYGSDLGHDTLMLSHAKEGSKFLWGWRETGTHMFSLTQERSYSLGSLVQSCNTPLDNWYLILVIKMRLINYADGFVIPIHAKSIEELEAYCYQTDFEYKAY